MSPHADGSVSGYAYVNPVVAVSLGALILGERPTLTTALGGAVVVASVIRAQLRWVEKVKAYIREKQTTRTVTSVPFITGHQEDLG